MPLKISLLKANCKRCGKELVSANRSLWGQDKQKNEFGVVCSSCASQEEFASINRSIGKAIQKEYFKTRP